MKKTAIILTLSRWREFVIRADKCTDCKSAQAESFANIQNVYNLKIQKKSQ